MTKRDFFVLVFKLFAVYGLILSLFTFIPSVLNYGVRFQDKSGVLLVASAGVLVLVLFILLIKQTGNIVTWLKLESGFDDERIDFQYLNAQDIIKIGTFILGGYLFIDTFPRFISNTLDAFNKDLQEQDYFKENMFIWVTNLINLIIGYLMITNLNWIGKKLSTTKKKEE